MPDQTVQFREILREMAEFARSNIYPRREELISSANFPTDIWNSLGEKGFLGLTLSTESDGRDLSYTELAKLSETLNANGGVPGLTMSLMTHWMFAKLHLEKNLPTELKGSLLPLVQSGNATLSVAISEPGVGAHPKHLKTTITREGDSLILNGEKTFLTNGPIATHFLVIAISDEVDGQKKYSAVLVPAESEGSTRTAGMKLDFLHPCPHGGIILKNVKVSSCNLLGREGDAFRQFSLSTRHVEDAIGAAAMQGSLTALLREVAKTIPDEENVHIGAISARIDGLGPLAEALATAAETENAQIADMYLGYRALAADTLTALNDLLVRHDGILSTYAKLLARDITKIQGIAKSVQASKLTKKGAIFREASNG